MTIQMNENRTDKISEDTYLDKYKFCAECGSERVKEWIGRYDESTGEKIYYLTCSQNKQHDYADKLHDFVSDRHLLGRMFGFGSCKTCGKTAERGRHYCYD